MVCARCQRLQKSTELVTPGVKRKNDMYYGSPAAGASSSSKGYGGDKTKASSSSSSATLANNGIGKSKLLGKGAKNPYAAYSSTCKTCKKKTEQGRTYCLGCAYKANACAMCGKSQTKTKSSASSASDAPMIQGQKFSAK